MNVNPLLKNPSIQRRIFLLFTAMAAIIVTAAGPKVPEPLIEQLLMGGKLVIPVGQGYTQWLQVWERKPEGMEQHDLVPVAFVPLIGEHGWPEDK